MLLSQLAQGVKAVITGVDGVGESDAIVRRLLDLGFVDGEPVRVIARGPLGGAPLAAQLGVPRFALRIVEAKRIRAAVPATAPSARPTCTPRGSLGRALWRVRGVLYEEYSVLA